MDHHHGVANYKGDVGDDLMGKVMGPTLQGKYMVCTGTTFLENVNKTRAEFDELQIGVNAPVVLNA